MAADPAFPHRPDHPDFWVLSNLILALDRAATDAHDPGLEFERLLAEKVDPNSISYMAIQRSMRAFNVSTMTELSAMQTLVEKGAALYTEAFLLGAGYQVATQDSEPGPSDDDLEADRDPDS